MKQIFLNEILCATRGKGCAILLILKLFSQKCHRPVKMMQSQPIAASDQVIPMPAIAGTVGTGYEESVQDRQEDCPFHIKLEFPFRKKPTNNFAHSQLLPEPFKDERRTNLLGHGMNIASSRQNQEDLLGETGKGTDKVLDLSLLI